MTLTSASFKNLLPTNQRELERLAVDSGVAYSTLWKWSNKGTQPTLNNLVAVLQTMGYNITLEKNSDNI